MNNEVEIKELNECDEVLIPGFEGETTLEVIEND